MNLLGSVLYDPAGAVSKVTTSLLAMTALDTTNLRVAVTVPAHGRLFFRLSGVHHGSTTTSQLFLGVMNGATILGRQPAQKNLLGTAIATTLIRLDAEFAVTGLTPGAMNCDAAYGVEIISSAGGAIKYGGPNDTTTNNAFGGFSFEVWDPSPNPTNFGLLSIDANGRIDVIKIAGTTQTARDIGASVLLSAGTGTGQLEFTSGVVKANATQFAGQTITASGGVTIPAATLASTTNITAAAGCAVSSIGNNVITAASINADAITAAKIADGAIDAATFAAGAINAAAIADAAIDNATFAADVGSTALATNMIGKAAEKAVGVAGLSLSAIPTIAAVTTVTTTTNLTNLPAAAALEATLTAMKGATFAGATDSLEAIRDRGDAAWATATGFATPTNITAASGITLAPTTGLGNQTANITGNLSGSVGSVTGAVGSVTGAVGSVTGSVGSVVGHTPQTGDSYARLGLPAGASIAADIANLPTAGNNANALLDLDDAIDIGLTVRHALELAAGSVLNKLSGAGTGTEVVRNFSDTANLATVTVDVSGNKTAITYDFSI